MSFAKQLVSIKPKYLLALLPLVGWIVTAPLLIAYPPYSDELQWKLINSRLLIDEGKLVYLFPACAKGFLLDPPITWYPARLFDALAYADLTNPQWLRYTAIGIFAMAIAYTAWFVQRIAGGPYLNIVGTLLAPLSLGVLPFLLIMNRPEQGVILPLLAGCTLPLLLHNTEITARRSWLLAMLYMLLAWIMLANHIKSLFLLPALLVASHYALRRWLPSLAVVLATVVASFETFQLWGKRTDCPESPFLTQIFANLSLSPADIRGGVGPLYDKFSANAYALGTYLKNIMFQPEYQSIWLPAATSPPTNIEFFVNQAIPVVVAVGLCVLAVAVVSEAIRAVVQRVPPRPGIVIAALLVGGLLGIAGFQITKNFYEAGLQLPLLGLAIILALPSLTHLFRHGWLVVGGLALIAALSLFALLNRFSENATAWHASDRQRPTAQAALRDVVAKCGIELNGRTSRVLMDDFAYSVLWRTREPIIASYLHGWWATGIDQQRVVRDRNVSYAVGFCGNLPPHTGGLRATDGRFCCNRVQNDPER